MRFADQLAVLPNESVSTPHEADISPSFAWWKVQIGTKKARAPVAPSRFSPASMGFLSSYLNLLRKDVCKAYQANEREISASRVSNSFRFLKRRAVTQNVADCCPGEY